MIITITTYVLVLFVIVVVLHALLRVTAFVAGITLMMILSGLDRGIFIFRSLSFFGEFYASLAGRQ